MNYWNPHIWCWLEAKIVSSFFFMLVIYVDPNRFFGFEILKFLYIWRKIKAVSEKTNWNLHDQSFNEVGMKYFLKFERVCWKLSPTWLIKKCIALKRKMKFRKYNISTHLLFCNFLLSLPFAKYDLYSNKCNVCFVNVLLKYYYFS